MSLWPRLPHRGAARVWRPRVIAAVPAAALTMTLAACAGGAMGATQPAGGGQSFVSGTPGTTVFGARGPAAPGVTGRTLTGARASLRDLRGHVVVLNFWGSWCSPCRAEAPTMATLARQLAPSGVRFLGVDIRDSVASAQAFDQDFGITYPSLNDPADEIALDFRSTVPPEGIPTTLVISRSGRISARIIGEASYTGLRHLIATVAAQPS